ncbi:hypothetical protein N789_03920 [Arenimonas oryziterrae DSM 21050 = YC6267]|uniref:Uncharacterized protein n=1 Tax=Arenimonas oryziterrae DSM 21050 = YC6267 TaxID=1121015 RepID=A0A091APY1_9GAMM|nr:hypothetical protein N789_03920 [Arenimonas oryziterrae DSM 21050 = YC6267]
MATEHLVAELARDQAFDNRSSDILRNDIFIDARCQLPRLSLMRKS